MHVNDDEVAVIKQQEYREMGKKLTLVGEQWDRVENTGGGLVPRGSQTGSSYHRVEIEMAWMSPRTLVLISTLDSAAVARVLFRFRLSNTE